MGFDICSACEGLFINVSIAIKNERETRIIIGIITIHDQETKTCSTFLSHIPNTGDSPRICIYYGRVCPYSWPDILYLLPNAITLNPSVTEFRVVVASEKDYDMVRRIVSRRYALPPLL
jgi:hypothetical protein